MGEEGARRFNFKRCVPGGVGGVEVWSIERWACSVGHAGVPGRAGGVECGAWSAGMCQTVEGVCKNKNKHTYITPTALLGQGRLSHAFTTQLKIYKI
jgi:hypothetical protein